MSPHMLAAPLALPLLTIFVLWIIPDLRKLKIQAEYRNILKNAISELPEDTPEARSALYDRAREALYAEFGPLDMTDDAHYIAAQIGALSEAIKKVEVEQSRIKRVN